jgi:hypothetical protein
MGRQVDLLPNMQESQYKNIEQQEYDRWMVDNIKNIPPSPYWQYFSTTFHYESPYGKLVYEGMNNAEFLYEKSLLEEIKVLEIPGSIIEFGVSGGWRLKYLDKHIREIYLKRNIYGFDSFEGLPEPNKKYDGSYWKKGMYAANFDAVMAYMECSERPYIKLIKGWFSDSLKSKEAQEIKQVVYARIDCDLYQPTVECLEFLRDRLVDKAILVFDDWTTNLNSGETKAFFEWLPTSGLKFEFLALNGWVHLYLRVHK